VPAGTKSGLRAPNPAKNIAAASGIFVILLAAVSLLRKKEA
jgi:hypothetical protein